VLASPGKVGVGGREAWNHYQNAFTLHPDKRYYFRLRYEYVFAAIKGENPVRLESKRGFLGGDIDNPDEWIPRPCCDYP
jgi:hypothetical protein